jgi:hypothetical protein
MEGQMGLFGTKKEQLLTVNEAIYAILKGGQSYRIGTRYLTRADLALLYDMQRKLQSQVMAEEEGGSGLFADTVVAVFDGR